MSTDRGEQDPQVQVDALKSWIEFNDNVVADTYVDFIPGSKRSRPSLDKLLNQLDEIDAVAVVKLDRLGRSTKDLIEIAAFLEEGGVDLMVKDQQIDTSTPAGKLMFHMLGAFAEFERDLISERTSAGMRYARDNKGVRLGRPRVPINLVLARRLVVELGSTAAAADCLGVNRRTLSDRLK